MNDMPIGKLLEDALSMEEKGYDLYTGIAKKSENDITGKTFNFLAEQEKLHIDKIKSFYKELKDSKKFSEPGLSGSAEKRGRESTIFLKTIKELNDKIKPSDDEKKACEFAMEIEKKGYKYYQDMAEKTKDENLLIFLRFLMEEESTHYELISSLYTYLTDSHNWFMYEEGSFPQGG